MNQPLSKLLLLVGLSLAVNPGSGLRAEESLQLRPSAQVDSEGVYLDQLVQASSAAPHTRLCAAPAFGKSQMLNRAQLTDLAAATGLELAATNWTGAEAVRVSRRARPLAEADLLSQLTGLLQSQQVKDKGDLELRCTRPWTTLTVPDEPLTYKILDLPTAGITSSFILRFQIRTAAGEEIGVFQTVLQAQIMREVWVARSVLRHGQPLAGADVGRERRDILAFRDNLADFDRDDPHLEFSETINAGMLIPARALKPRTVVHRGQVVVAMIQDGALSVSLKVEALEDGAIGQIIRARNLISMRDLRGKVLDEQNLLVPL